MHRFRRLDLSRLSTADKVLLSAAGLLFVDSFLPWQRLCGGSEIHVSVCLIHANEWTGGAPFVGILAALCTTALLVVKAAPVLDVDLGLPVSPQDVANALVLGVAPLTVIEFALVARRSSAYGAWIGLFLALLAAYGGLLSRREEKLSTTTGNAGFLA